MVKPEATKGKRNQARTRLARAAVVDAARRLFIERGYGSTTIEAISDLADVPPATVYRLFSSKHGILKSVLDATIVGDHQEVPMAQRPDIQALLAEPDPIRQLAGFVTVTAQVNARVASLYWILVSAAGTDPDAAVLLDELTRQRQHGQRLIAAALHEAKALRPELGEDDAADLIHALLSPEMYRLLVHDRGWQTDRYERWLADTIAGQLLPPGSTAAPRRRHR